MIFITDGNEDLVQGEKRIDRAIYEVLDKDATESPTVANWSEIFNCDYPYGRPQTELGSLAELSCSTAETDAPNTKKATKTKSAKPKDVIRLPGSDTEEEEIKS